MRVILGVLHFLIEKKTSRIKNRPFISSHMCKEKRSVFFGSFFKTATKSI
jgi:hypothetical protein